MLRYSLTQNNTCIINFEMPIVRSKTNTSDFLRPPCKVNGGLAVFSLEIGSNSQHCAYLQSQKNRWYSFSNAQ